MNNLYIKVPTPSLKSDNNNIIIIMRIEITKEKDSEVYDRYQFSP